LLLTHSIVDKLLDVLLLLSEHDNNRALLAQAGAVAQVHLAAKMNKKNTAIADKAAILTSRL
jgi:hypothetical protein